MTEEKPATDRRIERARVALSKEHYTERLWHSDFVKALIARIDTERTARLAAEARVKALEDALKEAADSLQGCHEALAKEFPAPKFGQNSVALIKEWEANARAALKEPANG